MTALSNGRVVVLDDYQGQAADLADWSSLGSDIRFMGEHLNPERLIAELADAEIVVTMRERTAFPRPILESLPALRLLVTTGYSNGKIDLRAARDLGIVVSRGTQGHSACTTELTWALILSAFRNLPTEDGAIREGGWQHTYGTDLRGKRLGLLGLGRLGTAMVPIARAFGLDVVAWSKNLTAEEARDKGAALVPFETLLHTCDIVSIHMRLSERTRGLLGARELAMIGPGALLVNTSRGEIIDETAMVAAVRTGALRVALDVYAEEPLPTESPLRSLGSNSVVTPHLGYVTQDNMARYYAESVESILAYRLGTPIRVMYDTT